jgi:hypothetical protein
MTAHTRNVIALIAALGLGALAASAATLTTPPESLSGLRPGMPLQKLIDMIGKPDLTQRGGLLGLYGGAKDSTLYGWYAVADPDYTIPDLAVEVPKGSTTIELVMAIGFDGLVTEKDITCFSTEAEVVKAYGKPEYAFQMTLDGGTVLRELYYTDLGISFDLVPLGAADGRTVVAIYVTYPEYLKQAIDIRREYIKEGTGKDVTAEYHGVVPA